MYPLKLHLTEKFSQMIENSPFLAFLAVNQAKNFSKWEKMGYNRVILDNTYRNPHYIWYKHKALAPYTATC